MDSLTREPVELLTRTRSRRWLMLGLCLLVVAGIGYAIWFWPAGSTSQTARDRNANQPIPVVVSAAEQKDVPIYLDGLGTVQAYNTVTVRAMVDGPLIEVNFKEGQDVKKGDLLAQIDPRTYQAALDQAAAKKAQDEAQLANARLDLARYQKLVANNYSSAQQADTARAQVAQLEAQVTQDQAQIDTARTQLGYTTIIAPLEGRTGMRQVDAGNIVHAADTTGMVMITQLHPISVMFTLPQQSLPAVANAMRGDAPKVLAYAQGAAGSPAGVLDTGTLAVLDNQVDPTTGTIKLKATFPNSGRPAVARRLRRRAAAGGYGEGRRGGSTGGRAARSARRLCLRDQPGQHGEPPQRHGRTRRRAGLDHHRRREAGRQGGDRRRLASVGRHQGDHRSASRGRGRADCCAARRAGNQAAAVGRGGLRGSPR